ncbi:MAG: hypothetical protein ACYTGV_16155, partial [Planctomycetota bacterium]
MRQALVLSLLLHAAAAGVALWQLGPQRESEGMGSVMVAIHLQSPLLPEEPPPPPQAPLPPPEPKEAIPLDEPEPEPLEPLPELPVVEVSLPTKREHAPLRRNVRLPKPLLSPVREMPQSLPPPVVRKRPAPPAPVGTTTPPRRIVERSPLVRYPSLARRMGMEGR